LIVKTLTLFALVAVLVAAASLVSVRAASQTLPAVGQLAPGFTLPSQDGSPISLASFRGKWVVLYFYPKDLSPGCTIEAHGFQRDLPQFEARNAVILGVSVDSAGSHTQFCAKEGLTFRLLSDPEHKVVEAYGSLGGLAGIKIASRNSFLIDPMGSVDPCESIDCFDRGAGRHSPGSEGRRVVQARQPSGRAVVFQTQKSPA
jgi:peroxiredoxin Q/BCP